MTPTVERLRTAVICLLLTAVVTVQGAGLVVPDTKLSLTQDPVGYLTRALHLWDPAGGAGQLQNQAYGYLFPEGPFHALLIGAGLPAWSVQRLWQSVVVVTAFLGARAVAGRLGLGTPGTRLLGALAFALAPRVISQLGPVSGELWPYALTPWVLLPLIDTSKGARRAAVLSGLAVLLAGGINAAATLAVLPLPALWLLTRGRQARRLALWWAGAVLAATAWWLVPLLLLGRYSPPFLDTIESAATTTGPTGLWSVLTGNDLWLQYLGGGLGAVRPAGALLVEQPALVLCTTVVAAAGLFGCLRASTPHRRFLLAGVLLGVLVVGAGHVGALTGPLAPYERDLLDGPLAAFRNVHKYDGLLRLPLALGLAEAAALLVPAQGSGRVREVLSRPVALLATLALVGAASPALTGLQPPGAFAQVPDHWAQTAAFLDAEAGTSADPQGRALVVPGAPFAEYVWGRPLDEPLVSLLDRGALVVRDNVPLGGPGVTRVLDAVQESLETGRGSPVLAPFLRRAGVRHVVARNDLDLFRSGAAAPVLVRAALDASPGLELVASFGPSLPSGLSTLGSGQTAPRPAVQVYEVQGAVPFVDVLPRTGAVRVSGGPESLLPLLEQGVIGADTPVRLAGEPPLPGEAAEGRVVTDGYRDREVGFGRGQDYPSATLGSGTAPRAERPVHDYLPVSAPGSRTTLSLSASAPEMPSGASPPVVVRASSSAADAEAVVARGRDHLPAAAFDGDLSTAWVTGGLTPVGQWVEADLGDVPITFVTLSVPQVEGADLAPTRVRLSSASRSTALDVDLGDEPVTRPWSGTSVRATIEAVDGAGRVGASPLEVRLSGPDGEVAVAVVPSLRVPDDAAVATGGRPADGPTTLAFSAGRRDRSGCVALGSRFACSPTVVRGDEDDAAIDRVLTLDEPLTGPARARARPRPGPALSALVQQGQPVTVSASSAAVADLRAAPATVLDGSSGTTWVAGRADPEPWSLTLTYQSPQRVSRLQLSLRTGVLARLPTRVTVVGDDGVAQTAPVVDGDVRLPRALTTREVTLTFPQLETGDAFRSGAPVGLTELVVLGSRGAAPVPDQDLERQVDLGCGAAGPTLLLDGQPAVTYGARATVRQLRDGATLDLTPCAPDASEPDPEARDDAAPDTSAPDSVTLSAGEHRLRLARTDVLQPVALTIGPGAGAPGAGAQRAASAAASRELEVRRWEVSDRRLTLGPGQESFLVVRESANDGWSATLDGTALTPVVLDGWQQGFVVPAGEGGDLRLTFGPDRTFRAALALGGLLALALLVCGVVLLVKVDRASTNDPASKIGPPGKINGVADGLVGPDAGPPTVEGSGDHAARGSRASARTEPRPTVLGAAAALLAVPLVGGLPGALAILVVVVAVLAPAAVPSLRDREAFLPAVGAGSLVLAGLLVAVAPWPSRTLLDAPVQALCLLALAALAVSLAQSCRSPRPVARRAELQDPGDEDAAPATPPARTTGSPPPPTD